MPENYYQFFVFFKENYFLRFGGVFASNISSIIQDLGGELEKIEIEASSFNEFLLEFIKEALEGRNIVIMKYLQNEDYLNDEKQTLSSFLTFFARSSDIKKAIYPRSSTNPIWILFYYQEK